MRPNLTQLQEIIQNANKETFPLLWYCQAQIIATWGGDAPIRKLHIGDQTLHYIDLWDVNAYTIARVGIANGLFVTSVAAWAEPTKANCLREEGLIQCNHCHRYTKANAIVCETCGYNTDGSDCGKCVGH